MRVRYIGGYEGISGLTGKSYKPKTVYEEPDEVAAKLLASGQFEKVEEVKSTEVSKSG